MKSINQTSAWNALKTHHAEMQDVKITDLFAEDAKRFSQLSLQVGELFLDYSKNKITAKTLQLLNQLANEIDLSTKINNLLDGEPINNTENRPALHTALRGSTEQSIHVLGEDIIPLIKKSQEKIQKFVNDIHQGKWLGFTGKKITTVVNIGIGGSHLGPLLTTESLQDFAKTTIQCYFVSNIDKVHLDRILKQIDPETTLFIISSKSFTTIETQTNAQTIKAWFQQQTTQANLEQHFIAITTAAKKAIEFGIPETNIFPLWDWVGGRYSIWSAIGLPLALTIGMDNFKDFLAGARAMDQHFRTAEFSQNMPVIMALIGIWSINFLGSSSHAIVPYSDHLMHLHTYLQQADMESNGKSITRNTAATDYATGPVIWGGQGCNGQHAFYQLLHQGKHIIPVDFILVSNNNQDLHHDMLVASGLSQAQALMQGKSYQEAFDELLLAKVPQEKAKILAHHKTLTGNRPSNVLFLKQVNPFNLGALLALYEHKIFVQGVIWDINSFDQWGVELGKQLMPRILDSLYQTACDTKHDSSTQGLINHYKNWRRSE